MKCFTATAIFEAWLLFAKYSETKIVAFLHRSIYFTSGKHKNCRTDAEPEVVSGKTKRTNLLRELSLLIS